MRILVLVKASRESEAGELPSTAELTSMGKFNQELVDAGVIVAGEGLRPSLKGKRVKFDGQQRTVVDGPFPETHQLVAGFWIWEVKTVDDAVAWLKRAPFARPTEVELRPIATPEDFGDNMTPQLREQEARLRSKAKTK